MQNGGRWLDRLPLAMPHPMFRYAGAVLLIAAGVAIRMAASDFLPRGYPYVSLFPMVMLGAFLFGAGPGACAAILGGFAAWYLFIPPAFSFALEPGGLFALLFYSVVVIVQVLVIHLLQVATRRLIAERERSRTLAERSELLFRELQHRVSNNIQVVAALLTLQKRGITDARAQAALDEAARRLGLIGRIHRQLHDPAGGRLGMETFLRELAADIADAHGRNDIVFAVKADENIVVEPDAAIPIALIVAEAVANALEHGFAGRGGGTISIVLWRPRNDQIMLTVQDDGAGLPEDFNIETSDSLGLNIATMLARQLGGTFDIRGGAGTTARLTIPG